jgi:hypothetical protein
VNLIIGIPTSGTPAKPFLESLSRLALPDRITGFGNISVTGNFVPAQRELIARQALKSNADYLLMVDDDIVAPENTIEELLAVFECDAQCGIAGGLYYSRDGLRPMAVSNWNPNDTTTAYTPGFADAPVEVDGVGFGCVLVSCKALRALDQPFFPAQVFVEEKLRRVRVCNEDYVFCHRLKEAGLRTYLHAGVRLGHYDRATGTTVPSSWESTEVTQQNRMTVRRPDGSLALVPFDGSMQRQREEHVAGALQYIFEA